MISSGFYKLQKFDTALIAPTRRHNIQQNRICQNDKQKGIKQNDIHQNDIQQN